MTKEEAIKLLCEHFSEGLVRTIVEALKQEQEQEYEVLAGIGKGVEIPAGWKYYYIKPKLPLQLKQEQDEPVAYINVEQRKLEWAKYTSWETPTVVNLPKIPLYTTPQTKEWVGLTNEQIVDLVIKNAGFPTKLAKAIEGLLKRKNT